MMLRPTDTPNARMLRIGPHTFDSPVLLAPMAGYTDGPFRALCRRLGAAGAVSEMLTSDIALWHTPKSRQRLILDDGPGPRIVQIAGVDPDAMAEAARRLEALGVDIIDINMGCPMKKVCRRAAGSALLREPDRVRDILRAVVGAVRVPVTLKTRTGWDPDCRNAPTIARLAEAEGIQALTLHGRTRACRFNGTAEFDTLRRVRDAVSLPLIANGDINSPQKAATVMAQTGADGVMIGRSALGYPWLFREVSTYLATGRMPASPDATEQRHTMLAHVRAIHAFYGETTGVRIARKHVTAYQERLGLPRQGFNQLTSARDQLAWLSQYFVTASEREDVAA